MRKYIAIIKGPEHIIKGGMLIEKFDITDEDIAAYFEHEDVDPVEFEDHAITYYMGDYTDDWEQKSCTVSFLTEEQFDTLYGEMDPLLKDEVEKVKEEDPLDECEDDDIDNYKTFGLSKKEYDKYNAWRKSKGEVYVGAIGGAYEFCFIPTGIGTMVKVKCADGTELDLTDYDLF
jgi:hypothetical protein